MIRIVKPDTPNVLKEEGREKTQAVCEEYILNQTAYDSGSKTFYVSKSIYGDETVKEALKTAQHDKCCFCESKITHIDYGDVEHFRPKGGYQQCPGDPLGRPGYYWLAYEWSNLLLSCKLCNTRWKGNLFPLENPADRARNHRDDLSRERALFINPGEEDPEEWIEFRQEIPCAVEGNPRGESAIGLLNLDRKELNERRLDRLQALKIIFRASGWGDAEAAKHLEESICDSSEYAAMARAAVKCKFKFQSARRAGSVAP